MGIDLEGSYAMKKLAPLTRTFPFGIAVSLLSIPALAQPTFIEQGNTGQLVARGVRIVIPVDVACGTNETQFADVNVAVTQRCGNRVVSTVGSKSIDNCTSAPQTVPVLVKPNERQQFCKGPAISEASLYACDESFNCTQLHDPREEIRIR